jgi:hypothetical protein
MFSHHRLTCQRCARKFNASRSDALFCSRSCRRAKSPPAPLIEVVEPDVSAAEEPPATVEEEDLGGWRRIGGFLVPPPDPSNTFTIW